MSLVKNSDDLLVAAAKQCQLDDGTLPKGSDLGLGFSARHTLAGLRPIRAPTRRQHTHSALQPSLGALTATGPAEDDPTPIACTYQGSTVPCTYFPADGSFSSGVSTCPKGPSVT
ncbi:hypothetical protein B0H14DRAFT_3505206 [Mycena olivaceomarginata]|nr:hypothetical protein B0H14DRAFT_3505206 [Mycena olivaceomarginata]